MEAQSTRANDRFARSVALTFALAAQAVACVLPPAFAASPAGHWQFRFDGDDTGRGDADVDANGTIAGSGTSDSLGVTVVVSGRAGTDGAMEFSAIPAGEASTGARFVGRVRGEKADGTWSNEALGAQGRWQAVRLGAASTTATPPSPDRVDCVVNGTRSRAILARADFSVDPAGTSGHFRLIAMLPVPTAPGSDRGPMLELKALEVGAPGSYRMSRQPTWLSVVSRDGKSTPVTDGKWNLTSFSFRGSESVAGQVKFAASGYAGECSFSLPMTVVDIGGATRR